jgi:hypothetical protein
MTFMDIKQYNFTPENDDINNYIKDNINELIYKTVKDVLYRNVNFDMMNLNEYLCSMKNMFIESNKNALSKAFLNGLYVNKIIQDIGWNYISDVKSDSYYYHLSLNYNHNYIYKDVDIVPEYAVISSYDAEYHFGSRKVTYKKIKENFKNKLQSKITRLYIDLTDGTMRAVGNHPNVSTGHQVCMGDLKGKISFDSLNIDTIKDLIIQCEQLLETINYSSSYNDVDKPYFTSNNSCVDAFMDNNCDKQQIVDNKEFIKDSSIISDDDFDDTEIVSSIIESDDFEEME